MKKKQKRGRPATWQLTKKEEVAWAHNWLSNKFRNGELSELSEVKPEAGISQLNDFIDKCLNKEQRKKLQVAIQQARYRARHKEKSGGEDRVTIKLPPRVYDHVSKMAEWREESATKWLISHLEGVWRAEKHNRRHRLKIEKRPPDPLIEIEDSEQELLLKARG